MAHRVWHTLPICEISIITSLPILTWVPMGICITSMPSVQKFSAKSPSFTSSPIAWARSMDSQARSETWRCQSLEACASFFTPKCATTSTPSGIGSLRVPLRFEIHVARMTPFWPTSVLMLGSGTKFLPSIYSWISIDPSGAVVRARDLDGSLFSVMIPPCEYAPLSIKARNQSMQ